MQDNNLRAGFQNLRIWHKAHELMLIVHGIANQLPKDKEREKINQAKRSSSSVPDNIAEGYSSFYYKEKIKGMRVARKEAGETQNHILAIFAKGYIEKNTCDNLVYRYQHLIRGINAYCKYINTKFQK